MQVNKDNKNKGNMATLSDFSRFQQFDKKGIQDRNQSHDQNQIQFEQN